MVFSAWLDSQHNAVEHDYNTFDCIGRFATRQDNRDDNDLGSVTLASVRKLRNFCEMAF